MNFKRFIQSSYSRKTLNYKQETIQEREIDYSEKYEYSMLRKTTLKEYKNSRCL